MDAGEERFGVGIVGLQAERGWAMRAHVPALRALPDDFAIVGVANTNRASAERAAACRLFPAMQHSMAKLLFSLWIRNNQAARMVSMSLS